MVCVFPPSHRGTPKTAGGANGTSEENGTGVSKSER